ncbi:MAG TPA: MMPL family transporter [Myxococcota bacterium]|nr:MMPL family transporter [Myxococcota bacterium]
MIARRVWVVALYALLLAPAAWLAAQVQQDNSTDRLIVPTDPAYVALQQFEATFGGGEFALLFVDAEDPFDPAVVERADRLERALAGVPGLEVNSVLSVYRRARAGFEPTPDQVAGLRAFGTGSDLLRRQGLVGDHHLALALTLEIATSAERHDVLAAIDRALAPIESDPGPIRGIHRLGQPWVNAWLDATVSSAAWYFALFAALLVVLVLGLYRSLRTLIAFVATLGTCLALSLAWIVGTGGMLTIVSPMVPMTILVTATASLVYLHSRFVERPPERPVDEHQIFALRNKFVAVTASVFATAVGFAALLVSDIRPVREMGLWVAVGLAISWVVVFTLFPALQKLLATPTRAARQRAVEGGFERLAEVLPRWSYRWRWPLVASAVALSLAGAAALFGVPGLLAPMPVHTDPVEYVDPHSQLYRDIRELSPRIPGLSITNVWLRGPVGSVSEPEVLTGLHHFQQALEADPQIGAAVGPTSILRLVRYLGGEGDGWPEDPAEVEGLAAELEALLPVEPMLARFVQPHALGEAQITVVSRAAENAAFEAVDAAIQRHWAASAAAYPALAQLSLGTVGLAPLSARVAQELVPTLVESFLLTAAIIFGAFLLVFRNGTARLMAMIPSIFAILAMFLAMRLFGLKLNVATILIASTVLGTSENDQIHFFYHFLERRRDGSVEASLRHALRVAGRAIFYATLINAGGFLAFAASDLPPMREFGTLTAIAFALSMLADFTALPAALWILFREHPDDKDPAPVQTRAS